MQLSTQLKKSGYKLTPARLAILEVLERSHAHPSHDQILEEAKKIYPNVSRATVYRTMELLVELNVVRSLYLSDPTQRFVSAFGGHHHLVCNSCGKTIEFDRCMIEGISQELSEKYGFQIQSHLLELHGLCADCQ